MDSCDRPQEPGSVQIFPPGTTVFAQADVLNETYLILDGIIKLVREESSGRELIVGLRFSGWFLGSVCVLSGQICPVSAVTVTRCRVRRLDAAGFKARLRSDAAFSWGLHEQHCGAASDLMVRLAQLGCTSVHDRLLYLLRRLAAGRGVNAERGAVRITVPLKQWELAQLVGATPEYMNRLLQGLQQERLISFQKGWLTIPDPRRLGSDDALLGAAWNTSRLSGRAYV